MIDSIHHCLSSGPTGLQTSETNFIHVIFEVQNVTASSSSTQLTDYELLL